MFIFLVMLIILMILGALVALQSKDLLSSIISLGIVGFALTIIFLILNAPDLAIVQIIIETLTLIILIAAIQKTTKEDTTQETSGKNLIIGIIGFIFCGLFLFSAYRVLQHLPNFGSPKLLMSQYYIINGKALTHAHNLVSAIILDFRGYDTLGEATVLFTSTIGVLAVLRKIGRKS